MKRVTNSEDHLCGLELGNTAPEKRRSGGEPLVPLLVSDLTGPGIESRTSRIHSEVSTVQIR